MSIAEVEAAFRAFEENLIPRQYRNHPEMDKDAESIVDALAPHMPLHSEKPSLQFGSATRGTCLYPMDALEPVDLLVVLNFFEHSPFYKTGGSEQLLQSFHEILSARGYDVRRSSDDVRVICNAATFDIRPAFRLDDGGFVIPVAGGSDWVRTYPDAFHKKTVALHNAMEGSFTLFVRMLKLWSREAGTGIESFHLETVIVNHFWSGAHRYSYDSMVTGFFNALPEYLAVRCEDPTTGNRLDEYLGVGLNVSLRQRTVDLAAESAAIARRAYGLRDANVEESLKHWSRLFGERFASANNRGSYSSSSAS